jgi:Holliday junction DNA helicase RuvA
VFNSISGEVTARDVERVCLATGGVEWELAVSRKTLERLPGIGQPARVWTHLVHREDAMRLYGFADPGERALFLDLQKVEGVGPRAALKILSGIDREAFGRALDRDDVDALSAVPGIGRKTAQKIILKLKGKLTPASADAVRSVEEDIATALVGMGFDRKSAKAAVAQALKSVAPGLAPDDLERELFRAAVAIAGASGARPREGRP